ncbi:MAG: uracil-DNA glycosylase family protein [Methanolobus sp.]
MKACKPFLEAQIQLLNPKVIILLGNTAEKAFCDGEKLEWGIPKTVNGKYTLLKIYPAPFTSVQGLRNRMHH